VRHYETGALDFVCAVVIVGGTEELQEYGARNKPTDTYCRLDWEFRNKSLA